MRNATVDFETFYDPANKYSLKNMTTEDYVTDPRFEVILVSVKMDDEETRWFSGSMAAIAEWFKQFRLEKCALTGHHARFDALILAVHFGIIPRFIFCTESMANPSLKPRLKSLSLANLCLHFGLPPKGEEVIFAMGKRRADFTSYDLDKYGLYCCNDTDRCRDLFKILRPGLSNDECRVLDMTIRMYIEPLLQLDVDALQTGLRFAQERKAKMLEGMEIQGITKKMLGSGPQFAQILVDRGIEPPMKQSPTWLKKPENERDPTKEFTYAFGKTDPEFLQLKEDFAEDEEITALLDARTETKSSQEESRCTKYIEKGRRHKWLRAAVVYYSTHTGRYGGDEGENVLNLTNTGRHKDKNGNVAYKSYLRFGFVAPPDHDVVALDYSQIEARITACTAGQADLIADFANGVDVYSVFAQDLYNRAVSKALAEIDAQAEKDRKSGKETILGAGFGMGPPKFRRTVRGKGLILSVEESERVIGFYRQRYPTIPEKWGEFTAALNQLIQYREPVSVGNIRFIWDDEDTAAIVLPNGMKLLYPGLRASKNRSTGQTRVVFQRARDKWLQNLWGGVVMNNWAQATAGILIRRAMVDIQADLKFRPALQVYDELVFSIPKSVSSDFKAAAEKIMTRPVDWMPDLPIAVEAKIGPSYGHV